MYISHEPDESKKNSALCVGVIEGDALVTVALGVSERVALSDTETDFVSVAVCELEAAGVSDIVSDTAAVFDTVADMESLIDKDAVRVAEVVGV